MPRSTVVFHGESPEAAAEQVELGGYAGFSVEMGNGDEGGGPIVAIRFKVEKPEDLGPLSQYLNTKVQEAWNEQRRLARARWGGGDPINLGSTQAVPPESGD